jgi:6-phosphogluconate dehydrogenase
MNKECDIGVIGLGAMGLNLLMNISDHGFHVSGLVRDKLKAEAAEVQLKDRSHASVTSDLQEFLGSLRKPRVVLLLVQAGAIVDAAINEISPFLSENDLIIDAGNSHFKDTDVREEALAKKGFHFFGIGVSGGEAGARHGPSIMPGGDKQAYERVRPILEAISAHVNGEPCVTYLGPHSAGHYVKMVHNGIEYGLMQQIAESYQLMKTGLQMSNEDCHKVFLEWSQSELNSYLLEITAQILQTIDPKTGDHLIDLIRDVAKQKGTGSWMCQDAMEIQVPVPTIDAAVAARDLSAFDEDRKKAAETLLGPVQSRPAQNLKERKAFLDQLKNAFYAGSVITFSQAMALLLKASSDHKYDLNLESIARIWRGGCIIRASLLEPIMTAFHKTPELTNLLLEKNLGHEVVERESDLRSVVQTAVVWGLPAPALMASLAYYDGLRAKWLGANLIQAQRDYFGAHTYERVDEKGTFHTHWDQS